MTDTLPPCPECNEPYAYEQGALLVCPMCGHEWTAHDQADEAASGQITDAHGTPLADGDSVTVIKDLKVKGSSITLKMGTKVKSIRLVGGDHEVDCKMDAGNFMLKACFLRKV